MKFCELGEFKDGDIIRRRVWINQGAFIKYNAQKKYFQCYGFYVHKEGEKFVGFEERSNATDWERLNYKIIGESLIRSEGSSYIIY